MLDIDLTTIILEILNFLVLSIGLYLLVFKPVVKRVESRAAEKERIEREMNQKLYEAEQSKAFIDAQLADLDNEIQQLVERARDQIERERSKMLDAVRAEAEQIRRHDEASIRRYQEQEMKEFNERLLNTLMALSGELIEKTAPLEVHDRLVQEANDYVWKLGKEQAHEIETLRRSIGERTPTVHIQSAHTLNPDQQRMLARTFTALTDRNVNFELETNPHLYSGVRVRVGDILVDNSIAAQLEQMRSDISDELMARISHG